jgi:hypothetical protein
MLEMECKSEEEAKKSEWRGGNLKHLDIIRGEFQTRVEIGMLKFFHFYWVIFSEGVRYSSISLSFWTCA